MFKLLNKKCVFPAYQRMISVTRYTINEVESSINNQLDKQKSKTNVSDSDKSKCLNEKQNKKDKSQDKSQDKQGSNVSKATNKMNDNYD